jgi:anti-sigma factor (TIGR02949 family)
MPRRAELDCASVRDRLDPFLDEDLGRRETERLRAHLDTCPGCREELRLARKLRVALRDGLPILSCPPEVTEQVLRVARAEAAVGRAIGGRSGRTKPLGWLAALASGRLRPAASRGGSSSGAGGSSPGLSWATVAALAALIALLIGVPFALRDSLRPAGGTEPVQARDESPVREAGPGGYSAAEVARAEREARMVLAAVAAVGRDAGRAVQDQVLEDALRRPARQAVRGLRAMQGVPEPDTERRQP